MITHEEAELLRKGAHPTRTRPRDNAAWRKLESEGLVEIAHNKTRGFWSILITPAGNEARRMYNEEQRRAVYERYEAEALF